MLEHVLNLAVQKGLVAMEDVDYTRNLFLEVMNMDAPEGETVIGEDLSLCFEKLTDICVARGVCEDTLDARDRFAARLARVERALLAAGKTMEACSAAELLLAWEQAK